MSHTVKIKTEMKNVQALQQACSALGLAAPERGRARFHDGQSAEGQIVRLPKWNYPVVIQDSGEAKFDNYNGSWGSMEELDKLAQRYTMECTNIFAAENGYQVLTEDLTNGEVKMTLQREYVTN